MTPATIGNRWPDCARVGSLRWLMGNSDGVVGLRLDGGVMPWDEVRRKYMAGLVLFDTKEPSC